MINKNEDFTAILDNAYKIDTASVDITVTLPTLDENSSGAITLVNDGSNRVLIIGTVSGYANPKLLKKYDIITIQVISEAYYAIDYEGYRISPNGTLYRLSVTDGGSINIEAV